MKRIMTVALAAGAGLLLGGCRWQQASVTRTDLLTYPHQSGSGLNVEVANGSIDVTRGGEAVSIEAKIRAVTQARLDATQVVATRQSDGTLNIRINWPEGGRKGNEGCSLAIVMPDAGEIELETSNGALKVEGVGRDVTLHTSNGAISVAGVSGGVQARTSNGRVVVSDVPGAVLAESSNGAMELVGLGGSVRGSTSNGAVTVRLSEESAGPVDVHSSNGAVRVEVGAGFQGELDASTSNGGLRAEGFEGAKSVEIGKRWAKICFEGEGTSKIRTSNGSVTLLRRGAPG
ncbi:MAG: hypothetical protein DYG94_09380 [Leptolyngbya sp. PLA3]|nr:MAG: hypothetical protein EDM82_11950 [Cyanobacteria bacterium CYA]MCE7968942.1 hypothetical protein [Leptolyngbya sp. PL-A3]